MQLQKYLGPDVSIWKHCKSGTKACRKSMSYIFFPTQAWEKIHNLQLYLHQSAQLLRAKLKRPAEASSVWRICFNTHPNHAGLLHFTLAFEPAAIVAATYYGFFPQICQVFFFCGFSTLDKSFRMLSCYLWQKSSQNPWQILPNLDLPRFIQNRSHKPKPKKCKI